MSPTSNDDHKCMDDISNNSSERNLSDEGQEGRDTMMYNSLVSPAKMPARGIDYNEEAKNAIEAEEKKRISLISMEMPKDDEE